MIRRLRPLIAAAAVTAAWSCGSERGEESSRPAAVQPGAAPTRPAANTVRTASLPDGCDLIPLADIERIVGPIEGRPEQKGRGCWYHFPFDSSTPEWAKLREWERQTREAALRSGEHPDDFKPFEPPRPGLFVEVDVTGAGQAFARGVAAAREKLASEAGAGSGSESPSQTAPPAGWDEGSAPLGRAGFTGRVGHVTVTIVLQSLRVPADTVLAMAGRVRDRIPDQPFAHPAADPTRSPPPGPDPCNLLTGAEAEAMLGKLAVPPFRSREGSPLADPAGTSCAYLTPGHRVLVLTPERSYGRLTVNAERMGGDLVSQAADLPGVVADTLEGPWDAAAVGLSGDLVFLKGSRSLTIGYLMSSTDAAGAIKLAGPALQRLAAEAEPDRPRVPDDGCPLSTALISEIIETPVRLASKLTGPQGATCMYQLEADPAVSVTLAIKPAQATKSVFEDVQSGAKRMAGVPAERIEIGQEGWAFGSKSQSRAAALAGGKVYYASIQDPLGATPSGRKDAMVRLVGRMVE
jgi:hypothetical protein